MLFFTPFCQAGFNPMGGYGGASWIEGSNGYDNGFINFIPFVPKSRSIMSLLYFEGKIYAGTWDGVFRLDDYAPETDSVAQNKDNEQSYDWRKIGSESDVKTPTKVLTLQVHKGIIFAGTRDSGIFKRIYSEKEKAFVWEHAGPPTESKSILALYSDGFNLYAGTSSGEIYRLNERSNEWESLGKIPNTSVYAFYRDGNYLYVGTDGEIFELKIAGVRKRKDWWEVGLAKLTNRPVLALFKEQGILYAGTYGSGVFKGVETERQDHTLEWSDTGLKSKYVFSLLPDKHGFLYAGTGSGVFRAEYDGTSLKEWETRSKLSRHRVLALLLCSTSYTDYVLCAGTDSGEIFSAKISKGEDLTKKVYSTSLIPVDASASIRDEYVSEKEVIESKSINILCPHSDGFLYVGTDYGIFKTMDGIRWGKPALKDESVVALYSYGNNLYAGTNNKKVFKKSGDNDTWEQILLPVEAEHPIVAAAAKNDPKNKVALHEYQGSIYAAINHDRIYKINDSDGTWEKYEKFGRSVITLLYPQGDVLYMGMGFNGYKDGLYRFGEDGYWRFKALEEEYFNEEIPSLGVAQAVYADEECLYLGTSVGVFTTTTDDRYIKPSIHGLIGESVVALHRHGDFLYAATKDHGIFKIPLGAEKHEWKPIGLIFEHVTTLASYRDKLYAGTAGGRLFETSGMIESWKNVGLKGISVKNLRSYDNEVYAETSEGNTWRMVNSKEWLEVGTELKNKHLLCAHQGDLYTVASDGQFYRIDSDSNDKIHWKKYREVLKEHNITDLASHGGYLYAATFDKVYKLNYNKDEKAYWQSIENYGAEPPKMITNLYSDGEFLYAAASNGFYKYKNADEESLEMRYKKEGIKEIYSSSVCGNAKCTKRLYVAATKGTNVPEGVFEFKSGGTSLDNLLPYKVVNAFYSDNSYLYAGTADGRIFLTQNDISDRTSWTSIAELNEIFSFHQNNDSLYVGTSDGVYERIFSN